MFCSCCKTEKKETDFLNKQEFCYQCMYRIKRQKKTEIRTKKIHYCRICDGEILVTCNQIGRKRTVFCSLGCAKIGHQNLVKEYWTRNIKGKPYSLQKKPNEENKNGKSIEN